MNLLITLIVGLFIMIGTFLAFRTKKNKSILKFSICIAFSVLIILALFGLLPESVSLLTRGSTVLGYISLLISIVLGFSVLKVLDLFIPHHNHNHKQDKNHHKNLYHIGLVGTFALIIHNFIEGAALYNTLVVDRASGLMMGLGVGIHNVPLGMFIATALFRGNKNKMKTITITLLIALSMFFGGLFSHLVVISEFFEGTLLAITFGMIMYIALFELLPHIKEIKKKELKIIGLSLGAIIMIISHIFH